MMMMMSSQKPKVGNDRASCEGAIVPAGELRLRAWEIIMQETLLSATSHARPTQQPGAGQVRIEVRTGSWNEKTKSKANKHTLLVNLLLVYFWSLLLALEFTMNLNKLLPLLQQLVSVDVDSLGSPVRVQAPPDRWSLAGRTDDGKPTVRMNDPSLTYYLPARAMRPLRRTRSVHLATQVTAFAEPKAGGRRRLVGGSDGRPAGPSCASLHSPPSPIARHSSPRNHNLRPRLSLPAQGPVWRGRASAAVAVVRFAFAFVAICWRRRRPTDEYIACTTTGEMRWMNFIGASFPSLFSTQYKAFSGTSSICLAHL